MAKLLVKPLILVIISFVHEGSSWLGDRNQDNYFDFIIFTQHWPNTVCKEWKQANKDHRCNLPSSLEWTIHGIWPTKNETLGPAFCNNSWHFEPAKIRPIESELSDLWIDVEDATTQYSLWVHEWSKHGTCAAQLESFNSELKYFAKGLDWMPKYDLIQALAKSEIVPSDSVLYTPEQVQNAIIAKWGVNPIIECRHEKGVQLLFEIRLCFNKTLDLIDCNFKHDELITNCQKSKSLVYPETIRPTKPYNYVYVKIYKLLSWLKWLTF